jgi:hypothetical protein
MHQMDKSYLLIITLPTLAGEMASRETITFSAYSR